jgi:hypothetical protein
MAYNIYKSIGTTVSVPDSVVDQAFNNSAANGGKGIGVQIPGIGSPYVAPIAQNFLQITENFCGTILPPDTTALQGQLWFNRTSGTTGDLYVRVSDAPVGGIANWKQISVTGSAAASFVPYFVPAATTFTVPVNQQALWTIPIDNEGVIDVEGILVSVD